MCEPVTAALAAISSQTMMAASLGVSALTAGTSYMAQSEAAANSAAYAADTKQAADAAMLSQNADLNTRLKQEQTSTALRNEAARKKTQAATATANATSEASGLSVDALLADYDRQYLNYADSQMQQLGFTEDQIGRSREGLSSQAQSRTNQAYSQITPAPSLAMSLGNFGADAIGSYQSFQVRDPLTGKYTI